MEAFIIVDIGTVVFFLLVFIFSCIGAGESFSTYIEKNSDTIITVIMVLSAILSFVSFCINIYWIKKDFNNKKTKKKKQTKIISFTYYFFNRNIHYSNNNSDFAFVLF